MSAGSVYSANISMHILLYYVSRLGIFCQHLHAYTTILCQQARHILPTSPCIYYYIMSAGSAYSANISLHILLYYVSRLGISCQHLLAYTTILCQQARHILPTSPCIYYYIMSTGSAYSANISLHILLYYVSRLGIFCKHLHAYTTILCHQARNILTAHLAPLASISPRGCARSCHQWRLTVTNAWSIRTSPRIHSDQSQDSFGPVAWFIRTSPRIHSD